MTEWRIITPEEEAERQARLEREMNSHVMAGGCPNRDIYGRLCDKPVTSSGQCRWHTNPRPRCGICFKFVAEGKGCRDVIAGPNGWEHL